MMRKGHCRMTSFASNPTTQMTAPGHDPGDDPGLSRHRHRHRPRPGAGPHDCEEGGEPAGTDQMVI
jgi:hypothetical protein